MKTTKLHIFLLSLAVMLVTLVPTSIFAISNPDTIQVKSVSIFRNYLEANDLLFIVEYNVYYSSVPSEDPRTSFTTEIINGSTGASLVSRPNTYYGYAYNTLYLTAVQSAAMATAMGIEGTNPNAWDTVTNPINSLVARITGISPVPFATVTLGDNKQDLPINAGDTTQLIDGTLSTTPVLVGDKILEITESASIAEGQEYTQITNLGDKLSITGGTIAMKLLPGIRNTIPDIFAFSSSLNEEPNVTFTNVGSDSYLDNKPTAFSTSLDAIGQTLFGKPGTGMIIGGIGFLLLGLTILGMVFNVTQAVTPAMVAGIPLVLAGTYLGVIPMALAFAAFFFVLVLFGITFIMSRMA